MDTADLMHALQSGIFGSISEQMLNVLDDRQKRNLIALVMLHATASYHPYDVPRSVDTAFKLADAYLKKANDLDNPPAPIDEPEKVELPPSQRSPDEGPPPDCACNGRPVIHIKGSSGCMYEV